MSTPTMSKCQPYDFELYRFKFDSFFPDAVYFI